MSLTYCLNLSLSDKTGYMKRYISLQFLKFVSKSSDALTMLIKVKIQLAMLKQDELLNKKDKILMNTINL